MKLLIYTFVSKRFRFTCVGVTMIFFQPSGVVICSWWRFSSHSTPHSFNFIIYVEFL